MAHPNLVDRTGQVFGRLRVVQRDNNAPARKTRWICQCECGAQKSIAAADLVGRKATSCGCFRRERGTLNATHGETRKAGYTKEYTAWRAMISRCEYRAADNYPYYGERGISVCAEWRQSFEAFLASVGRAPTKAHSIDRIDPDGDYEPGNVRWAIKSVQARNTRKSLKVAWQGQILPIAEVCQRAGIKYSTAYYRAKRGLPMNG